MRRVSFFVICAVFAACSGHRSPLAEAPLAEGGTVARLLPAEGPAVVLVIHPKDVMSCYQPIWQWTVWERENPGRFLLLLAGEPTPVQRRQLVLRRIRPDGVLGADAARYDTPSEYVYDGRRLHAHTDGKFGPATARLDSAGAGFPAQKLLDPYPAIAARSGAAN